MKIFDTTLYENKPSDIRMHPATMMYKDALLRKYYDDVVIDCPIFMDFEDQKDVQAYKVFKELKALFPNQPVGNYMAYPQRDFWRAVKGYENPEYQEWVFENTLRRPTAMLMDIIVPSLYTFYATQTGKNGWESYARANILEAQRYGKEVFPVLRPLYHESARELAGTLIPQDYFSMQLDICLEMTGNVVIWGGWQEEFNENEPWYKAVLSKGLL